jgi:hypothetical protein
MLKQLHKKNLKQKPWTTLEEDYILTWGAGTKTSFGNFSSTIVHYLQKAM